MKYLFFSLIFCTNITYANDSFIGIGADFNFRFAYSTINRKQFPKLRNLAKFLKDNPEINFHILGHTDNIGSFGINQELSDARAENIKYHLVNNGVEALRLTTEGLNMNFPVASNDTALGRAKNRRAVFEIKNFDKKTLNNLYSFLKNNKEFLVTDSSGNEIQGYVNIKKYLVQQYKSLMVNERSIASELPKRSSDEVTDTPAEKDKVEVSLDTKTEESETAEVSGHEVIPKPKKTPLLFRPSVYLNPSHLSNYYGNDINYEYGGLNPLGLGLKLDLKAGLKNSFNLDLSFFSTELTSGNSGLNFINGSSYESSNIIGGLSYARDIASVSRNKISALLGLNYYNLSGIEAVSATDFTFRNFSFYGPSVGLEVSRKITEKLDASLGLHYLHILNASPVSEFTNNISFQSKFNLSYKHTDKIMYFINLNLHYLSLDMVYDSGLSSSPEYLIQNTNLGITYIF